MNNETKKTVAGFLAGLALGSGGVVAIPEEAPPTVPAWDVQTTTWEGEILATSTEQ